MGFTQLQILFPVPTSGVEGGYYVEHSLPRQLIVFAVKGLSQRSSVSTLVGLHAALNALRDAIDNHNRSDECVS